jgi:hypothetical protein
MLKYMILVRVFSVKMPKDQCTGGFWCHDESTSNIHDRDMCFTLAISLLHKGNGNNLILEKTDMFI